MSTEGHSSDGSEGDKVLVAEYALGLLAGAERERLARRIAAEPALAEELRLWQSRLASLDGEFAETPAPAQVLERVEARLFPSAAASPPAAAGWWDNLLLWRGIAAGSLAIAVAAIGFALLQPRPLDPDEFASQMVAALTAQEGSGVEFVALYDMDTGRVRLRALSGQQIENRDYQLWMIEESGTAVPMGLLSMEPMDMMLPDEMQDHLVPGTILAVTLEPQGGSPTGDPTGPVVAKGMATMI
jgi:anti-sigma-K factor RskA